MHFKQTLSISLLLLTTAIAGCGGGGTPVDSDNTDSDDTDTSQAPVVTDPIGIVINEIVAAPESGGNDWLELYVTEGSFDLSNFTIVDDNADHDAQALPSITLSAGEYLVIQAIDEDDTPPTSGYYVTFKLGGEDALYLYNDDVLVDYLSWNEGDAPEGYSYGRYEDGSDNYQTLVPTAGEANIAAEGIEDSGATLPDDTLLNENAELRVNEIVAKAEDDGYDWIELYVTGSNSINLADYTLSDESGAWESLPSVSLAPGEYYQIFAVGEDLADSVDNSVAFKLGSSDFVSLYKGDDLVDQLSWSKGDALLGESYGRFSDGSDRTQTLSPTPLAANATATKRALIISEVMANDPADGADWFELTNAGTATLSLSNYTVVDDSDDREPAALPDVQLAAGEYIVIYATDEDPGAYYVPFKLGNSDSLSLIQNDETIDYIDWDASDVISGYSYGRTASPTESAVWHNNLLNPTPGESNSIASAFNFSTVADLHIDITDSNWQSILDNPLDEEYHETAITLNGLTLDSVAIRTKGGSSLSSVARSTSDRYSFKVDINKYVDGQKFFNLKKFTLQNSFNDPTYMREEIAYELLDFMGVPSPKRAYVNLYVNDELIGLYLMVEAVDGEFIENHYANTEGDMYKPDGTGSDLVYISSNISSYSEINLQNNETTSDQGAFINFVESLDDGSDELIDVDQLLRYMSVSTALSNMDSYHGPLAHNYYFYENDGVFSLLPWDFNESFGTFNMNCNDADIRELTIDDPTSSGLDSRPLLGNVFSSSSYLSDYHDYLYQLIDGPLSASTFENRVEEIADLIRTHVENDPSSFYGSSAFETNLDSTYDRFYGLTSFIEYRVNNMEQQLTGEISSGTGDGFCSGSSFR